MATFTVPKYDLVLWEESDGISLEKMLKYLYQKGHGFNANKFFLIAKGSKECSTFDVIFF